MLDTYLDYFNANYTGNRAPLHIGHHFTDYQRGAYREALKTFARVGLRPAGGALRQLQDAGRYHGQAKPGHARGLSEGRFRARRDAGDRVPAFSRAKRRSLSRAEAAQTSYATFPASQPSMARLRVMPQ